MPIDAVLVFLLLNLDTLNGLVNVFNVLMLTLSM